MFIYILMIGLVAFGCFFYMQYPYVLSRKENTALIGPYATKCYLHPMFLLVLVILLFPYVIRYNVGTDFSAYHAFYEWHQELTLQEIMEKRDFGYYLLEKIDGKLSNNNWYFHCTVIALLTYFPVLYYYVRYSNNLLYSMMIYILFMLYFSSYNAIRQTLASSFVIIAIMMLFEKKYAKSVIALFIAYSFHSTVLLIIPLFMLCLVDYRRKWSNAIKLTLLASAFVLRSIWERVINMLYSIGQDKLANDYADVDLSGEKGTHILRVAVYAVPVILVFAFGKRIFENIEIIYANDKKMIRHTNFLFNASQMALIFMMVGQMNWIFARFAAYFSIFIPVLFSYIYSSVKKQYRSLFCILSIVLFFVYMYLLLPVESNLLPFKTEFGWYFR